MAVVTGVGWSTTGKRPPGSTPRRTPTNEDPAVHAILMQHIRYAGRRLLPDLDESCASVAGAITPRVGGVGPTTVAMLFRNAVELAERRSTVSDR
ncbi:hypothetical protein GCM10027615_07470 [Plantactinospora veratri]